MYNTRSIQRFIFAGILATSTLLPIVSVFAEEASTTPVAVETTNTVSTDVPVPPPQPVAVQPVANPYGFEALWNDGDVITKSTIFILLLMSIGTWYIIITKLIQQAKIQRQGKEAEVKFWAASSIDTAAETLTEASVYRFIAEKGINSTKKHGGNLLERIDFNTWVTISIQRAIDKIHSHLSGGLAFLATVGSTAPFVGLFGTVWGIYHALTAIGISGQASIDKVAGPVGEALIMTAIGLAVAVPAVLGYNWLIRRNKAVLDNIRAFGSDLHMVLLSGEIKNDSKSDSK
ncbi:MotA/TolQ/ExbB proton channel family protein [Acinetobacter sp. WCHAc060033]|uniref:MotA/TolQ/ExbB proton channel family protein n=1 Tax=Acinetobacter sp. WCHAc060033 TaxID=2518624 RepID=UPI001023629C|nr:MotA/TolQ/ExbB proton channel family protein [Acinetobacter sp. WCHAc060033]RZG87206.1 MotA/TolQ/ExbB proton channel family protein [Acinetobacter sp. WCHAc060033]